MNKIIYNFHTHTKRCGHARDEDEEYVLSAIDEGIKELGFSDHIYLKGIDSPGIRMNENQVDDYIKSINFLKEKYKDKINIHLGFEAEYIPEFSDEYKKLFKEKGIEYMICGQHCRIVDNKQDWYNSHKNSVEFLKKYVDDVIEAIKSGFFTYIAHPDLIIAGYQNWDDIIINESKRLIENAIKYDVLLEINVCGLRNLNNRIAKGEENPYMYPYGKFWDLVSTYGNKVKVVIGVDAHGKDEFKDGIKEEALEFANKHKLNLIDKITIKKQG